MYDALQILGSLLILAFRRVGPRAHRLGRLHLPGAQRSRLDCARDDSHRRPGV